MSLVDQSLGRGLYVSDDNYIVLHDKLQDFVLNRFDSRKCFKTSKYYTLNRDGYDKEERLSCVNHVRQGYLFAAHVKKQTMEITQYLKYQEIKR